MAPVSEHDTNPNLSKLRIAKNLVVISTSFLFLFSGFHGLSMLQSTMNKEDGVGTISQSLTYIMFCVSSLLIPKYVIQKLGCKTSIILSQIGYIPWVASNFYPRWIAMIPSAMLTGIAASILWGAQCTYFNKASSIYCSLMETEVTEKPETFIEASTEVNSDVQPLIAKNTLKQTMSKTNVQITCDNSNCDSKMNLAESPTECVVVRSPEANKAHSKEHNVDALHNSDNQEAINSRFFAFHSLVFRSSEIWSNLLSYYILTIEGSDVVVGASCSCGASFCNVESECLSGSIGGVGEEKRFLLTGICVAVSSMAVVLLLLCLDSIEKKKEQVKFSLDIVMATWNQCKKKEQLFLVPITLLIGLVEGFYTADITKAYIGCALGTHHVGLVTVASGISCALLAPISGWFVRHIGRIPIISLGIAVTIATNILLLTWTPNVSQPFVFYLIAALWGVINGTIWSQIPAFYGVLFKKDEEAAFATFYVWNSLGWTVALVYSNFLCTYIKIYILIVTACAGFLGYLATERSFALRKRAHLCSS